MSRSLLIIVHIASSLLHIAFSTNCSAIDAYVQVLTTANNVSETYASAQALFPPCTYYVPYTELVMLNARDDDICDATAITTDISNKIVLLFEGVGSCSSHYKVWVAERNGATAVLLAVLDGSGGASVIVTDDTVTTTIPTRAISYTDGEELATMLSTGILYI